MRAFVSIGLHPTENRQKVTEAAHTLFPETALEGEELLTGEVHDLKEFRELIEKRQIRNTLETILERNHCAGSTYLLLNKQAALAGKPNVYAGQELGPLKLELQCNPEEIHPALWGETE